MKQRQSGCIINIGSAVAVKGFPQFVAYSGTKGAVLQITRALALEVRDYGIRVNCVCPGSIYTPATEQHIAFKKANKEEFLREAGEGSFLKRVGKPEEVAYAALFLASEEASFITGTQLVVDGGATV